MIGFIIKNKEWLFSGIGVTILTCIVLFIKSKLDRRKKEAQKVEIHLLPSNETSKVDDGQLIPIERVSLLSFSEIYQTIKEARPLQRDEIEKSFIGIKVIWDCYLKSASKIGNDIVSLMLAPGPGGDDKAFTIWCKVSLHDYPELGILPEGAKIRIQGKIAKAGMFDVELINAQLFFLEENE